MVKIAVVGGNGKMGSEVVKALKENQEVVVVDKENFDMPWACGVDLVVDFSCAEVSANLAKICEKQKFPLVIGSTGQSKKQLKKIYKASKTVPIFMASNFSVGIQEMKDIIQNISLMEVQSIVIHEKHHCQKKDTPSGTAKELADVIQEKFQIAPSVLSTRAGKEIGTHSISLYFGDEVLEIRHQAFSRRAFVRGVKLATEFMLKNPPAGLYGMQDLKKKAEN